MSDEPVIAVKESTLFGASTRFWLAFTVVSTCCALALLGMKIEEPLYSTLLVCVSFYFGQKTKSP